MLLSLVVALALQSTQADVVTLDSYAKGKEPQIAIDSDDHVYIAYCMGDATYVSISADRGKNYQQPVKVVEAMAKPWKASKIPAIILVRNGLIVFKREGKDAVREGLRTMEKEGL
jgi:hypothetical protein